MGNPHALAVRSRVDDQGTVAQPADEFVSMYVNEWTVDYGEKRRGLCAPYSRVYEAGIILDRVGVEFLG